MAQLVVAAAGAAIGGALVPGVIGLGITGAAAGWAVGSLIGSAFAPAQKSEGPRLNDLSVGSSAYGTPIPYVQGSPRIAGQIVWASAKREIATTTRQGGKGGGKQKVTTYTYEVDLLIVLTDNVIAGISRVWSNGKLVYSKLSNASGSTLSASTGTPVWSAIRVYTGSPSQLPDPTYEAAVGTANAPAYRGRGSVFLQGLQLGQSGQIPNLTFEVFTSGTTGLTGFFLDGTGNYTFSLTGIAAKETSIKFLGPSALKPNGNSAAYYADSTNNSPFNGARLNLGTGDFTLEAAYYPTVNSGLRNIFSLNSAGTTQIMTLGHMSDGTLRFNAYGGSGLDFTSSPTTLQLNQWNWVGIRRSGTTWTLTVNGVSNSVTSSQSLATDPGVIVIGHNNLGYIDHIRLSNDAREMSSASAFYSVDANSLIVCEFDDFETATLTNPALSSVVSAICLRAGMSAGQIDVTSLAGITLPVRALTVAQVSSARTVLDMMASAYFFDIVLSDKLYFRARGGASAATLTYDDLGVAASGSEIADPLPLTQASELEVPAQVALTYNNIDSDYQSDTQYSDRLLTGQESTSAVQLPLGFTASEAKQIVDRMLADQAWRLRTTLALDMGYTRLEPADVITATSDNGSQYRLRLLKRTEADGVLTFEAVIDDATVLTQAGTTSTGIAGQTAVSALPNTSLELLDIPMLADTENQAGIYVAVTGSTTDWTLGALYESVDGTSYTLNTTITDQAAIGTCTTTLGNWTGGNVFDDISTVTVNVGTIQTLSSYSRDSVLIGAAPAYLIGSEIVYALNATLISLGVYTLSGLLRGRRGTDWASTGHVAAERFVELPPTGDGIRFAALNAVDLGSLRYYKALSAGQLLSAVAAKTITPGGITLKPFSPVNARVNRDANDHVITWSRRTRLSTRLVGSLPIYAPLGEATEAYELEVFASSGAAIAGTPVLRTITATAPSATYTSAERTADGTGSAVVHMRIYQMSAAVGRGYPLITSA